MILGLFMSPLFGITSFLESVYIVVQVVVQVLSLQSALCVCYWLLVLRLHVYIFYIICLLYILSVTCLYLMCNVCLQHIKVMVN